MAVMIRPVERHVEPDDPATRRGVFFGGNVGGPPAPNRCLCPCLWPLLPACASSSFFLSSSDSLKGALIIPIPLQDYAMGSPAMQSFSLSRCTGSQESAPRS